MTEIKDPASMQQLINILVFTNDEGEKVSLEYQNVWYIENNGLDILLDPIKYNVNELSNIFPASTFDAVLAVKDVENSEFSYHTNLICRSITLNKEKDYIKVTLPGLTEEAKRYLELQNQLEQIQANLDYLAMETEVDLEL